IPTRYHNQIAVAAALSDRRHILHAPLYVLLTCGTTKHTDNCDRKLSPHPTIFRPKIYLLLTKTAPPFLTVPLVI
ncbi:hypothetical protein, partial [Phascolarctobacterium succinatutens]|uniref:hypothetical protein n=1 Tax=Phascolarctobacterium succinatutens TaxID=626940 RepID=UPI003AB1BFBD